MGKLANKIQEALEAGESDNAEYDSAVEGLVAKSGKIDISPEGASVNNVIVTGDINNDWSKVFELFNMDANLFEVVEDTVKMSTWQQSARTKDGHRDTIQLWSYSARFKRKALPLMEDDEVEDRSKRILDIDLKQDHGMVRHFSRSSKPVAAVINLADIQGGKSEGGGVAATQQRLLDGLVNVQDWLNRMSKYHNITELVIANNGDPMEGCDGSYASQLFTVELNTRGQMNFVLDIWEKFATHLFPQFDKAQFVSVLCNHGMLGRQNGRDNKTSDSDNAGGFLAETLKRILDGTGKFDHVEWTIPHDEMTVYPNVAGVPMAFNHGHKIGGSDAGGFEKWLNGQVRGDAGAHAAEIWQTAHRHHFACWDMGSCTVFQAPSLDGGSKWLKDITGRYSRSGILAYLVGEHLPMKWTGMEFL